MFLVFSRKVYPLKEQAVCLHSVSLQAAAAEMTPDQTPCVWEEVQAVMLIPFFYLFNETSFLPFQRRGGFDVMC